MIQKKQRTHSLDLPSLMEARQGDLEIRQGDLGAKPPYFPVKVNNKGLNKLMSVHHTGLSAVCTVGDLLLGR